MLYWRYVNLFNYTHSHFGLSVPGFRKQRNLNAGVFDEFLPEHK